MIRWETRGHVGLATIDRPEQRNALNAELCDELRAHLDAEPGLRAVVITGSGEKAFCAGADLGRAPRAGEPSTAATTRSARRSRRCSTRSSTYPAPVIAAVNGHALGAGMQLAVACDLRVVAPDATLRHPRGEARRAPVSPANIARLAALVGQGAARDILLTARAIDVDEAAAIGLVQRVADDALAAALELADEIAALAPLTVQGHKRALNLGRRGRARRRDAAPSCARSRTRAFAQRRPPGGPRRVRREAAADLRGCAEAQ